MSKPTDKIPNSNALAGFMNGITARFGVADAATQSTIDEALEGLLSEHGVKATVLPLKWGKITIEAADAPSAQAVQYMMTQIEELLKEREVSAEIVVRAARRR